MSARVCRSCDYTVVSTVVTACPHCGTRLPSAVGGSSAAVYGIGLALVLIGGGAAFVVLRETPGAVIGRPAAPPSVAAATATGPAATTATAASGGSSEAELGQLIAQLDDPQESYTAAYALARSDSPRAQKALMAAYDQRDYGKMVGATAFYVRRKPAGYEKVMLALLAESRDLAVAQDLILSGNPKLAIPAVKWAGEQGFKLVPSRETPTGYTWTSVSSPQ
jgi:hypothetical protein